MTVYHSSLTPKIHFLKHVERQKRGLGETDLTLKVCQVMYLKMYVKWTQVFVFISSFQYSFYFERLIFVAITLP